MPIQTDGISKDPIWGNVYVKSLWFESVASGTSGTLTPPTQGTIVLDQWASGVDALASQIADGQPNYVSPLTAGGAIVTATLDESGAWTLSDTPSAYPVAIIYVYKILLGYFNLDYSLGAIEYISTAEGTTTTTSAFNGILSATDSTVQKALEKLDNGAEPALTKGNLTGTSPITLSATRQVIGGAAAISLVNDAAGTITEVDTGALADSDTVIPTSKRAKDYADLKLAKASNLSDVAAQQTALNNITAVSAATNEHVLTKDTATGNAVFKVAASGGGDVTAAANLTDHALLRGDGGAKGIQDCDGPLCDDSGRMTNPNQPAFCVAPSTAQNDFAVGVYVTIVLGTEIFDQGSNFASNTFTAPTTGRYSLGISISLANVDTGASYYEVTIVTSNRIYATIIDPKFTVDLGFYLVPFSVLTDMDAGDTAYVRILQVGGTQQTDIRTDTVFSGFLVC